MCPLLAEVRDVPAHHPVVVADDLGDDEFRNYFVVQIPEMLDRYQQFVAPAIPLADNAAMERIARQWELSNPEGPPYGGAVLVIAGRQDATVGYAAATDLLEQFPRATLAVLDGAGHGLPHEQPDLLAGLIGDWLGRAAVGRPEPSTHSGRLALLRMMGVRPVTTGPPPGTLGCTSTLRFQAARQPRS